MNPESIADGAFYDLRKLLSADLVSRLEADGRLVYYEIDGENIPYAIDVDGSHLEELIGVFNSGDILAFVVSSKNVDGQKALAELICAD